MTEPLTPPAWLEPARTLAAASATLAELIQFTRRFDPTAALQQEWGADFDHRRDEALARLRALRAGGERFAGDKREVLLCMAFCVDTAPYAGVTEEAVRGQLSRLLTQLLD